MFFITYITKRFDGSDRKESTTLFHLTEAISFGKGKWEGKQWSIVGLGLTKLECDIYGYKPFRFNGSLSVYLGKHYMSFRPGKDLERQYRNVEKYRQYPFLPWLKARTRNKLFGYFSPYHKVKTAIQDWYDHLGFNATYSFMVYKSYEGNSRFKADMLSAFQLASNYEMDLYLNRKLIFSPLRLEWEENQESIRTYLGERFCNKELGNRRVSDSRIIGYHMV